MRVAAFANKEAQKMVAHNSLPEHRARAVEAIARQLCSADLTDGFCGPRDGKCIGQKGERPSHRNCMAKAKGCVAAMESVGVKVVWSYDPLLTAGTAPDPFVDAAERVALGLP